MRKAAFLAGALILLGLAGAFILRRDAGSAAVEERVAAKTDAGNSQLPIAAPPTDPPRPATAGGAASAEATKAVLESRFKSARDLWQFAESVYPAASKGEPEAQYYLSRALSYCDDGYRFYFIRGNKRRTLDEAMQWASTRPGTSAEEAREIHAKCSRLQEGAHPFGKSDDWLKASTDGDYALAMVESARKLVNTAGVSGQPEHLEMRNEAKRLALGALRSKDPEVIFDFGDLAALFVGDIRKASQEQWVWRLAACKRGLDCSQDAEWYRKQCRFDPNCQPYETGVDSIRRINSEDFDEIERLANDLNSKLDANDFGWFGS